MVCRLLRCNAIRSINVPVPAPARAATVVALHRLSSDVPGDLVIRRTAHYLAPITTNEYPPATHLHDCARRSPGVEPPPGPGAEPPLVVGPGDDRSLPPARPGLMG